MMADEWNYYHYEYASELGYHDAKSRLKRLLDTNSATELKSLLTEYPEIRKRTRHTLLISLGFLAFCVLRFRFHTAG